MKNEIKRDWWVGLKRLEKNKDYYIRAFETEQLKSHMLLELIKCKRKNLQLEAGTTQYHDNFKKLRELKHDLVSIYGIPMGSL